MNLTRAAFAGLTLLALTACSSEGDGESPAPAESPATSTTEAVDSADATQVAEELKGAALPPTLKSRAAVEALLEEIRARGYAATNGQHKVAGVEAAAAPVFNFKNEITMAVLVVGVQGMLDTSPESEAIKCLKRHAEALSLRLGAYGELKTQA